MLSQNPPPIVPKKPLPQWLKYLLAACAGAGAQSGADKIATDSPVHFAVDGEAPAAHDQWSCEPEGGIVGAPMVCRPKFVNEASTDAKTE